MLDYYGSIIMGSDEVDSRLIESFKHRCHEDYLLKMIKGLREEGVLSSEYSVSGWMVFGSGQIHKILTIELNYLHQKGERKVAFLYCFNKLYDDIDVCRLICEQFDGNKGLFAHFREQIYLKN